MNLITKNTKQQFNNATKVFITLSAVIMTLSFVTACGQKGALYLTEEETSLITSQNITHELTPREYDKLQQNVVSD